MDIDLLPYFLGGPQYLRGPQDRKLAVEGPVSFLTLYLQGEIERGEQFLQDERDAGTSQAQSATCRSRSLTTLRNLATLVDNRDFPGVIRFLEEAVEIMQHVLEAKRQENTNNRELFYPDLELFKLLIKTFRGHT